MSIHRIDIGEAPDSRLIAQVTKRRVSQIKVDTLEEQVRRHQRLYTFGIGYNGCVITHSTAGTLVVYRKVSCQALDQRKFTERRNLCSLHIIVEYVDIYLSGACPWLCRERGRELAALHIIVWNS